LSAARSFRFFSFIFISSFLLISSLSYPLLLTEPPGLLHTLHDVVGAEEERRALGWGSGSGRSVGSGIAGHHHRSVR